MKRAGVAPTAEAYTSLMSACMKQGSPENVAYAFEVWLAQILVRYSSVTIFPISDLALPA